MLFYGCEPGKKTNADSCLINSFIERVKDSKIGNGAFVLPGKLHDFRTKNGGESVFIKETDLHFFGPDPLAYKDSPLIIPETNHDRSKN